MDANNKGLDTDKGINLALDPNLITLPINGSINPQNYSSNAEEEANQDISASENSIVKPSRSLINNPYEIYGQMPLTHLLPLILQQRNIPFSQLSEEDIINSLNSEVGNQFTAGKEEDTKENQEHDAGVITSDQINLSDLQNEDIEMRDVNAVVPNTINNNNVNNSSHDVTVGQKTVLDELPSNMMTMADFNKIRSEMLEQTTIALNESSLALETVSLLLSATRENNAKSTISPFLKNTVPLGSLNGDTVPQDPQNINDDLLFNVGWKLKCLNDSEQILRDSVDKLKIDLMKEHTYWRKIGKYISNNDILFKMRNKTTGLRTLAVKYGFEDSGSNYDRDRGIAILRNNMANNRLELIPLNYNDKYSRIVNGSHNWSGNGSNTKMSSVDNTTMETFLKVRIFTKIDSEDDYILSGESSSISLNEIKEIKYEVDEMDDSIITKQENIRGQIQNLKDMIFEKELIYQLKKECSLLISYGVTIENENKILIELPNEKFEIELVHRDDITISNHEQDAPKINDKRANLILVLLKMLVTVHFKKNLRNKYRIIESGKRNRVNDILLIRPILSKLRHQNYKKLLKKIIKDNVLDFLPEATIEEMDTTRTNKNVPVETHEDNQYRNTLIDRHIERLNKEIAVFDGLLNPPSFEYIIKNPRNDILKITLSLPNYCTANIIVQYENNAQNTTNTVKLNERDALLPMINSIKNNSGSSLNQQVLFHSEFSEFKEVEEFLHFIVTEYMIERKESIKV